MIQRLFAVGLSLQGATRLIANEEAKRRVDAAVGELDVTVRHIRTVIFDVESAGATSSLRGRVLELTHEAGRLLGFDPTRAPERLEIRRRLGYLPQNAGLYQGFTAYDLVDYVAVLKEMTDPAVRREVIGIEVAPA